jgi:hypothetical protein
MTGGPRLSAQSRALSPSLSRCSVGPACRRRCSRARPLPLSLCPTDPTCQRVPNLSPTISPPWTCPRPRFLRPRPSPRAPFEPRAVLAHLPSSICALCPALSLSLALPTRIENLRHRCQRPPPVPWPLLRPCPVQSALPSATRDTLRCALSLSGLSGPRSPEWFLRSRSSATVALSRPCASAVAPCLQRFPSR